MYGYPHMEGHDGGRKTCQKFRDEYDTEMDVYFGTNEYRFEKLKIFLR